jgi:hypothetical protein
VVSVGPVVFLIPSNKLAVQIEVVEGRAGPSEREGDVSCVIANGSFCVLNVFELEA